MCKASSKWKWFNNMSEFEFSKLYLFNKQISDKKLTCKPNNRKHK